LTPEMPTDTIKGKLIRRAGERDVTLAHSRHR
jgi:hypothetical protein